MKYYRGIYYFLQDLLPYGLTMWNTLVNFKYYVRAYASNKKFKMQNTLKNIF